MPSQPPALHRPALRGKWTIMPWPVTLSLGLIMVTIVYPVFMLLLHSLFPHLAEGSIRDFGLPYAQMLSTPDLGRMWVNSLACGVAATFLAWTLGIPAGWLLARTSLPGKRILRVSLLVPAMSPPYLVALAYVLLAQDNGLLEMLLGYWPSWARDAIFSFHGVVFVMGITSFGVVGLLVEATLYSISGRQEDVARCLGTSPRRIFWKLTLPLLAPSLLNAGVLVFIDSVSNFGVAAIMGPRANLPLLPAMIYELLTTWPTDIPLAAALSSILALTAMGTVSVCHALIISRSFLSGRVQHARLIPLNGFKVVGAWLFFGLLFFLSAGLPVCMVLFMSLIKRWGGGQGPVFSLDSYLAIIGPGTRGLQALSTSILLSITAATICVLVGAVAGYAVARYRGKLVRLLDQLSVLPRILPNLVVAVAIILAWNARWIPLQVYGTLAILVIAYVTLYQATALRFANAAMRQVSPRLEQAAACLGTPPARILRSIVFPLIAPSLLVAWVTVLVMCLRDWVASMVLRPPGSDTVGSFIFSQFEQGDQSQAMAMAFCAVILSTTFLIFANVNSYRQVL